jgi:hypothetical protein
VNWDIPYPKVTVCKRPHYEIQYEQVGPHTFVHLVVDTWTLGVKKELYTDCDRLQALLGQPVYVLCDNAKLFKFCTLFGFKPVCSTATAGGAPALILIRKYNE